MVCNLNITGNFCQFSQLASKGNHTKQEPEVSPSDIYQNPKQIFQSAANSISCLGGFSNISW